MKTSLRDRRKKLCDTFVRCCSPSRSLILSNHRFALCVGCVCSLSLLLLFVVSFPVCILLRNIVIFLRCFVIRVASGSGVRRSFYSFRCVATLSLSDKWLVHTMFFFFLVIMSFDLSWRFGMCERPTKRSA